MSLTTKQRKKLNKKLFTIEEHIERDEIKSRFMTGVGVILFGMGLFTTLFDLVADILLWQHHAGFGFGQFVVAGTFGILGLVLWVLGRL